MIATSNFLLPNATIFVELLAFLIVFWLLAKKVLPFINKAISERQEHIKASLSVIDEAKVQKGEAKEAYDQAIAKARDDAQGIIETSKHMAEEIRAEAKEKGQAEHDRIVANATQVMESARQAAILELEQRVGELALDIAQKIIGAELDASRHATLIEQAAIAVDAKV